MSSRVALQLPGSGYPAEAEFTSLDFLIDDQKEWCLSVSVQLET